MSVEPCFSGSAAFVRPVVVVYSGMSADGSFNLVFCLSVGYADGKYAENEYARYCLSSCFIAAGSGAREDRTWYEIERVICSFGLIACGS